MDVSVSELWELLVDREAWRIAIHEVTELDTTEWLNWTEFNIVKTMYDKPTTNIILSVEKLKVFPLRSEKKKTVFTFTTII